MHIIHKGMVQLYPLRKPSCAFCASCGYFSSLRRCCVSLGAALPRFHDLSDRFLHAPSNIPAGVVRFHLPQVTVVAYVVADAVLIDVSVLLFFAGEFLRERKGLEDGATVIFTTTEVVDFGNPWSLNEGGYEAGDIKGVYVVADLFPFVAEDAVLLALKVALHEVAEEAVQLDPGVIGSGEAATAQCTGGHAEVAAVLLDHHIGSYLGGSEEGVLALIDGEVFGNAVGIGWIGIVPAGIEFF